MNNAIVADAAAGRLGRWGRSTTVDEHTGEPVLPPETVRELHALAGLETDGVVGNAALIHCYGYLRSMVQTPYGPKHARWTGGGVARALGIDPASLLPEPVRDERGVTPLAILTPILERMLAAPPRGALVIDETGKGLAARSVLVDGEDGSLLVYGLGVAGPIRPITIFPIAAPAEALAVIEADAPRLRYNAVDAGGLARARLDSRVVRRG